MIFCTNTYKHPWVFLSKQDPDGTIRNTLNTLHQFFCTKQNAWLVPGILWVTLLPSSPLPCPPWCIGFSWLARIDVHRVGTSQILKLFSFTSCLFSDVSPSLFLLNKQNCNSYNSFQQLLSSVILNAWCFCEKVTKPCTRWCDAFLLYCSWFPLPHILQNNAASCLFGIRRCPILHFILVVWGGGGGVKKQQRAQLDIQVFKELGPFWGSECHWGRIGMPDGTLMWGAQNTTLGGGEASAFTQAVSQCWNSAGGRLLPHFCCSLCTEYFMWTCKNGKITSPVLFQHKKTAGGSKTGLLPPPEAQMGSPLF